MNKYDLESHPGTIGIEKLRQEMLNEGVDWLVIYTADPHLSEGLSECDKQREHFSGFTGSAGTLVINESEAFLWTDSRYYVQAASELNNSEIVLMKDGMPDVADVNEYIANHVWPGQTVAMDFRTISANKLSMLRKKVGEDISIVDGADIIKKCWEDRPKRSFGKIVSVDDETAGLSVEDKIQDIRNLIEKLYVKEEESYSYVISDLCSIMWIMNLRGEDVEHVPVAYSYLIINNYSATLYIRKKNTESSVVDAIINRGIILKDYNFFENDLSEIASDVVLADYNANNSLIIERLNETNVREVCDYKLIKKYIKNPSEIKGMEEAHIKDALAMIAFIKKVKDNAANDILMNEYDAGLMLDNMRLSLEGCEGMSFDTICGFNENGAIVHYKADKEGCKDFISNGLLLVDSGAHYTFGTTDITRTIVLGEISEKAKECYTAVLKGNLNLMAAIFAKGIKGEHLDVLARTPIWEAGYDYGHGTGHGISCKLSVHEPYVSISYRARVSLPLESGMIISDEPGIYLENEFGIRLENALLVENRNNGLLGFRSLTLVPFDRDGILIDKLTDKEKQILNSYHKFVYESVGHLLDEELREYLEKACQAV